MKNLFSSTLASLLVLLPGMAGANSVLIIDEWSSTLLTASINGQSLTVNNTAPNQWDILFLPYTQGSMLRVNDGLAYWPEPESTASLLLGNALVSGFSASPDTWLVKVFSDFDFTGFGNPAYPSNGYLAADKLSFTDAAGRITSFDVQFTDHGDTQNVPDASSTLVLLLLAAVGLIGIKRLQLA